ncbi:hypothetical protein [Nonomuraea sp. SYSU D8015]|uniref:hypothetical protein n=1 Tax=Nonomuraea sp. SYSU D8015 TaxID=2593644 RepID=UPI001661521B|nr:hypothetical protein [Nonomuraea sp. SYSU D8015]
MLAGPEIERAARWLTGTSELGALPAVSPEPRPGVVVSCGEPAVGALAGLLARATERAHAHVSPSGVADRLAAAGEDFVALVGLPEDIEAIGDWMGTRAPLLGVVTARGLSALSALVYRSLVLPDFPAAPDRRLVHPSMPGSQHADVIGYSDKEFLTDHRSRLLVLRSHGRECCVHLPDGVICGRSDVPGTRPEPAPSGRRIPACMLGAGCYRHDLEPEDRIPARTLAGDVIYVHACEPVVPGVSAMPHSVNVALGFLDGTTVAVVGAVGRQRSDPNAEKVLAAALDDGLRLGEAVRRLNEHGKRVGGEMSVAGLLGDPAIIVPARAPEHRAVRPAPRKAGSANEDAVPLDPAHLREVRHLTSEVLPALQIMPWVDVPVDLAELARIDAAALLLAGACLQPGNAAAERVPGLVRDLADDLAALQQRALEGLAQNAYDTWWQFGGPARTTVYRQVDASAEPCPHCGRGTSRRVTYRHGTREALELRVGLCRRCGPWEWQVGPEKSAVRHQAPIDVIAWLGEPGRVTMRLSNPLERTVRGATAFCFANGGYEGLQKPAAWPIVLKPGEEREVSAAVHIQRNAVMPDLHEAMFMTLLDGVLTALPIFFDVRPTLGDAAR